MITIPQPPEITTILRKIYEGQNCVNPAEISAARITEFYHSLRKFSQKLVCIIFSSPYHAKVFTLEAQFVYLISHEHDFDDC
jgi:hypothetical protein